MEITDSYTQMLLINSLLQKERESASESTIQVFISSAFKLHNNGRSIKKDSEGGEWTKKGNYKKINIQVFILTTSDFKIHVSIWPQVLL